MMKQYSRLKEMALKIYLISMILTGCTSVLIMISCGQHTQKPTEAFDLVKKERMMSNDSSFVSKQVIQESMKTQTIKKIETPDEWTRFKTETEKKIRLNESKIREIKAFPDGNASMRRKVASLEKANNDLRIRLEEYKEEVKAKWEMFQASMNHTVNEIDIELNAIKENSKK